MSRVAQHPGQPCRFDWASHHRLACICGQAIIAIVTPREKILAELAARDQLRGDALLEAAGNRGEAA